MRQKTREGSYRCTIRDSAFPGMLLRHISISPWVGRSAFRPFLPPGASRERDQMTVDEEPALPPSACKGPRVNHESVQTLEYSHGPESTPAVALCFFPAPSPPPVLPSYCPRIPTLNTHCYIYFDVSSASDIFTNEVHASFILRDT